MKDYLVKDPWKIIEKEFHKEHNQVSESIFSIGNGYMGVRGTFAERYSGETLQGSYLSGIYYPDKTRVGWWKNGYPEYFAKVLNSVNWIGIDLSVNGNQVDLNTAKVTDFHRELDMRHSIYRKSLTLEINGGLLTIQSERFCSQVTKELGVIKYTVTSESFEGSIELNSYLDANVKNQDSNYDEVFWNIITQPDNGYASVSAITKKTDTAIHASMHNSVEGVNPTTNSSDGYVSERFEINLSKGESVTLHKYVAISTAFHQGESFNQINKDRLDAVSGSSYDTILNHHKEAWEQNWEKNDIEINGDVSAQQGMRFNILQLYQTYDGSDERLNIGPKGFTGEKYGGCTYWDTEAYCLPFYLSTADSRVARSLLVYRHKHLQKAIENAEKLGFSGGAALYPMVTMNGEECHNEWEITFEEIHRNGAIAFAIYDYVRYTGDKSYLVEYGLEVLLGIARFWSQRFQYSEDKQAFVMLGVTGPNEYENNVNNNWYTNYIARWCMQYCNQVISELKTNNPDGLQTILGNAKYDDSEADRWNEIIDNTYLPFDEKRQIYLQQDGFLDKELLPIGAIPEDQSPIHQHWSWDRILRSCYIKQADVLQGMYFFEDQFDVDTIKKHYRFYEPMTVHESSLSPCIHAVLACRIGDYDKAYEMYLRTARLDLDDYNNDTEDGLHITSMAGTWLAIVKGFGGMKVDDEGLSLAPTLPPQWDSMSFRIVYQGAVIKVKVDKVNGTTLENLSDKAVTVRLHDKSISLDAKSI
jgi:maltose phosphorylase